MRIAQVAPLVESVPPKLYGGTERVVSYLTEELVAMGHNVTVFASGDSETAAELVPITPRALRLDPTVTDHTPHNCILLDRVLGRADEFDVIHFHIDLFHFPALRALATPFLTTLHGRLDTPDLHRFYRTFPNFPLVSISNAQRAPMPPVSWLASIHHGLPRNLLNFHPGAGDYLVFLGRIAREKGPLAAVEIAKRSGMKLKIAAKVDAADKEYFEREIRHALDHPLVEFIGEVGGAEKDELLGRARGLLFPIDWPEPFGLVMIESMACGTPVIAFRRGSVPEVLEDGVTGFVVDDIDEAVAAAGRLDDLDRRSIRRQFETRFTADRMAMDYVAAYERLLDALPESKAA